MRGQLPRAGGRQGRELAPRSRWAPQMSPLGSLRGPKRCLAKRGEAGRAKIYQQFPPASPTLPQAGPSPPHLRPLLGPPRAASPQQRAGTVLRPSGLREPSSQRRWPRGRVGDSTGGRLSSLSELTTHFPGAGGGRAGARLSVVTTSGDLGQPGTQRKGRGCAGGGARAPRGAPQPRQGGVRPTSPRDAERTGSCSPEDCSRGFFINKRAVYCMVSFSSENSARELSSGRRRPGVPAGAAPAPGLSPAPPRCSPRAGPAGAGRRPSSPVPRGSSCGRCGSSPCRTPCHTSYKGKCSPGSGSC